MMNSARPQQLSDDEQQKLKAKVVGLVRAILIPEKQGLPVEKVNREYKNYNGENIPFRKMGYSTLEDFLDQNPQMCRIQRKVDGWYLYGVATQETAHIAKMVSQQRSSKRKAKPKPARRPLFNNLQQRPVWSPPNANRNYPAQHQQGGQQKGFQNSRRFPGGSGRFPVQNRSVSPAQNKYRLGNNAVSNQRLRAPHNAAPPPVAMFQQPPPTMNRNQTSQQPKQNGYSRQNSKGKSQVIKSSVAPDFFRQLLKEYFLQHNLGPVIYRTAVVESKAGSSQGKGGQSKGKSTKKYLCTVKVGGESFRTFPDDFATEELAEEAVSRITCQKLGIDKISSSGVADKSSRSGDNDFGTWSNGTAVEAGVIDGQGQQCDLGLIVDRVVELVGNRTNGVWSTQIDVEYSRKYKGEKLPEKWTEMIEGSKTAEMKLRVDRPIPDRCIILPNLQYHQELSVEVAKPPMPASTPSPAAQFSPLPDVNHLHISPKRLGVSRVNGNVIGGQSRPPALVLPEDNLWNVYVTCVHSTMNVCVRLLGDSFSSEFDDLVTNMELHYFEHDKIPPVTPPVVVGKLYAAKVEGEWHRVEVTNVSGQDITCYFIDHGDEEVMVIEDLREIDPKFLGLAPQAKHVRLAGLESFKDKPEAQTELTNMALGKSLVGNVYSNDENGVSLVLFDTSGDDQDININETLLDKLCPNAPNIFGNGSIAVSADSGDNGPPPLEVPLADGSFAVLPSPSANGTGDNSLSPASVGEMDIEALKSLDLASMKALVPMAPPKIDSFFDVSVTMAGSPSNFTVQSYAEEKNLEELQAAMNLFYRDQKNRYPETLTSRHLEMDSYFAGKHADGIWYRVKVNSMLDCDTAAVKIVDIGDFSMIGLSDMQPLWPQFRTLPIQAINASLSDIVAVNGDWTPDDTVWFTKRVVSKLFVSKIKDVAYDIEGALKLSVSLFDTSDPEHDVLVDKELVDAGRAVYLCV